MKSVILAVALVALFQGVVARTNVNPTKGAPSAPSFPQAFSSTVVFEEVQGLPHFGRIFVDFNAQVQRTDLWDDHAHGHATFIENYGTKTRYTIAGNGNIIECWYRAFAGTMTPPSFSNFNYFGIATVHGVPSDHWGFADRAKEFDAEYFDRTDTQEPVAWTWRNGTHAGRFEYFEMDIGSQEAKIFSPAYEWPAVTCNQAPNMEVFPGEKSFADPFGLQAVPKAAKAAIAQLKKSQA